MVQIWVSWASIRPSLGLKDVEAALTSGLIWSSGSLICSSQTENGPLFWPFDLEYKSVPASARFILPIWNRKRNDGYRSSMYIVRESRGEKDNSSNFQTVYIGSLQLFHPRVTEISDPAAACGLHCNKYSLLFDYNWQLSFWIAWWLESPALCFCLISYHYFSRPFGIFAIILMLRKRCVVCHGG